MTKRKSDATEDIAGHDDDGGVCERPAKRPCQTGDVADANSAVPIPPVDTWSPAPQLVDIPAELLLTTANYLDQRSCSRLARTSRTLRALLEPTEQLTPTGYELRFDGPKATFERFTASRRRREALRTLYVRSFYCRAALFDVRHYDGMLARLLLNCSNLKVVCADELPVDIFNRVLFWLSTHQQHSLEELTLTQARFETYDCDAWKHLMRCKSLKKLQFLGSLYAPYAIIGDLQHMRQLQVLTIGGSECLVIASHLRKLQPLREFHASEVQWLKRQHISVFATQHAGTLTHLWLQGCHHESALSLMLITRRCRLLETIDLSRNTWVTNTTCYELAHCDSKALRIVWMVRCAAVSDIGAHALLRQQPQIHLAHSSGDRPYCDQCGLSVDPLLLQKAPLDLTKLTGLECGHYFDMPAPTSDMAAGDATAKDDDRDDDNDDDDDSGQESD